MIFTILHGSSWHEEYKGTIPALGESRKYGKKIWNKADEMEKAALCAAFFDVLVGCEGLEPTTYGLRVRSSTN